MCRLCKMRVLFAPTKYCTWRLDAGPHPAVGRGEGRWRAWSEPLPLANESPVLSSRPMGVAETPPPAFTDLLHEVAEEDGLLPQWVVHQPIREEDHALWEVVLRQPRHHPLLLHVRPPGDVKDHVSQVLPVPVEMVLEALL